MVSILNTIASIAGIDLPFILVLAEDYVVFCLEFFSGIKEFLVITLLQITGKIFRIASAMPVIRTVILPFSLTLPSGPISLEEMDKSELDAKLRHSYEQARSRQGKPLNDVFNAIERKHT